MTYALLTVQGANRAGIVADISLVLNLHRINIADTSMTTLRSEFVMMLLLTLPNGFKVSDLQVAFAEFENKGLRVYAQPVSNSEMALPDKPSQASHAISVMGPDQTGIVYQVSTILAAHQVNILSLDSQLLDRSAKPLYAMILEIDLAGRDLPAVKKALDTVANQLGVDLNLHALDYAEI